MSKSLQAKNANEEQVGAPWQGRHKVFKNTLPQLGLQDLLQGGGWMHLTTLTLATALGTHGNAAVALQLWGPAGVGFTFTWKLGWDYHRQQYSASMDLEERFHPTPISHYFPLLVLKLLYSSCSGIDCSKHREGCGWEGNHWRIEAALCHWCSLVYTGIEPL